MNTRTITKMALQVALCGIAAFLSFPLPLVPGMVTALTIVFCLIGLMLPPKEAFITLCLYVLLGAIGLPVYTGGASGMAKLFGPTGGFIWSFPIAYTLLSIFKGPNKVLSYFIRATIITIPITHLMGMAGGMIYSNLSFMQAFWSFSAPFIPLDIVKCFIAAWIAVAMKRAGI